jgi:hypothetical protein
MVNKVIRKTIHHSLSSEAHKNRYFESVILKFKIPENLCFGTYSQFTLSHLKII